MEPSISECSLRLCPIEVSLSSVPQMIVVGTSDSAWTVSNLSSDAEVREELRDHLERRRRQHLVDELDVARRHVVAERERVGGDRRDRSAEPPQAVDGAVPAGQRGHEPRRELAAERRRAAGSRIRCESIPPAVVEIRPTPTTRSPNSSGCCSASAMIVIPPIEWPTSTTGPSGTTSSRICLGRGRAARWSPCPRWTGRSDRASAGRSRRRGPARGSRPAGSASSRG